MQSASRYLSAAASHLLTAVKRLSPLHPSAFQAVRTNAYDISLPMYPNTLSNVHIVRLPVFPKTV